MIIDKSSLLSFFKKNWFGMLTAACALGILVGSIVASGDLKPVYRAIKGTSIEWMIISLLLIVAYWLLDAVVLRTLALSETNQFSFGKSFEVAMIGLLYSALTPFAVGGQPTQVYMMAKSGIPAARAISIITVKSITYQACIIAAATVSMILTMGFFDDKVPYFYAFLAFGFVCNIVFLGVIFLMCVKKRMTTRLSFCVLKGLKRFGFVKNYDSVARKTLRQIDVFHRSIRHYKDKKMDILKAVILNMIQLLAFFMIPVCIYNAFSLSGASVVNLVCANALITMITAFVPLPGASGAAEGGFFNFFYIFFNNKINTMSAVLIWRLVTYYSCIFVGMGISISGFIKNSRNKRV